MDPVNIEPMIDELEENIDDLEIALSTLLSGPLSDTASKLPVLDRAQLYVTATWSIESILFSYLRLNGVNAKEHPVFRELTRVKQYFDKIKDAETGDGPRPTNLDKAAAGRFIKHALAGNEEYDQKRAQLQAGEKARAHIRFEELSKKRKRDEASKLESNLDLRPFGGSSHSNNPAAYTLASRSAQEEPNVNSSHEDSSYKSSSEQGKPKKTRKHKKRRRRKNSGKGDAEPSQNAEPHVPAKKPKIEPGKTSMNPAPQTGTAAKPSDKSAVQGISRAKKRKLAKKNKNRQ